MATDLGTALTRETLSRLHNLCGVWRSVHRSLGRYVITAVVQPAAQSAPEPPG